jgi:hypothetical protein
MIKIKRDKLNPRHKAVQLNKKGGWYLLEYCINKGKLLNREIKKDKLIGKEIYVTLLHLGYYINGYYAYIDIELNTNNGFHLESAIYWNDKKTLQECRFNHYGHGISIDDKDI